MPFKQTPARLPGLFRRVALWLAGLFAFALAVSLALWPSYCKKRPLPPAGGLYFFKPVELAVPFFRQGDPRWRDDRLGWTDGTLGGEGCAVASAAMVLGYYGIRTDPRQLNWYLSATGGYTDEGWIYWEAAANLAPDRVRKEYEDAPSFFLIDWNLIRANPVIARLRLPGGSTHFVVICGKRGFDYLIRDPMAREGRGIYPLRELGSPIEALRFYGGSRQ
jgi:hypothetical protein